MSVSREEYNRRLLQWQREMTMRMEQRAAVAVARVSELKKVLEAALAKIECETLKSQILGMSVPELELEIARLREKR